MRVKNIDNISGMPEFCEFRKFDNGDTVECILASPESGQIAAGIARRYIEDAPDARLGRKLAFSRAVKDWAGNKVMMRAALWNWYRNISGIRQPRV